MRTPCCHTFLAFILKFLNFLQTFIGISIIIYSAYMLNQWKHHTPPPAPTPYNPEFKLPGDTIPALNIVSDVVFGVGHNGIRLNSHTNPAPWFIYAFMGVGILICCITCIGHIAAEAINGCCLCFYALLTTVFVLLEASLVAFIALDHQWEKDLPLDPTGELDSVRAFIEKNADVLMWFGISIIVIQVRRSARCNAPLKFKYLKKSTDLAPAADFVPPISYPPQLQASGVQALVMRPPSMPPPGGFPPRPGMPGAPSPPQFRPGPLGQMPPRPGMPPPPPGGQVHMFSPPRSGMPPSPNASSQNQQQ